MLDFPEEEAFLRLSKLSDAFVKFEDIELIFDTICCTAAEDSVTAEDWFSIWPVKLSMFFVISVIVASNL